MADNARFRKVQNQGRIMGKIMGHIWDTSGTHIGTVQQNFLELNEE